MATRGTAVRKASSKELRIGLIGASGHSGGPLKLIADRVDLRLSAVALAHEAESFERIRRSPAFTEETVVYDNPEALLDAADLDAVIINPPYGLNAAYATLAARRGLPVYLEKPFATELDDLDTLAAVAREKQVPIVGMFELRSSPVVATAARLVREGAIGRPLIAYGQKTYKFDPHTRPKWYADRALYGGTIPWVAIHAIDWTRHITGLEFEAVSAHQTLRGEPPLESVEIAGTIQYEFEGGGSAVISFDFLRPLTAPTHGDDRFRVIGTEGELWGSVQEMTLRFLRSGKRSGAGPGDSPEAQAETGPETVALDGTSPLFEQFIEALLGRGPMPMSTEDGLASTRAALLAREAAVRRERLVFARGAAPLA